MGCGYISSNDNRLYAAVELMYGQAPPIGHQNRFPAVKLGARQTVERPERLDKTGTRTFPGSPAGLRKKTTFQITTYLTSWAQQASEPGYGAMFQAGIGGGAAIFNGATAAEGTTARVVRFTSAHGLEEGRAISFGGELRFVTSIVDEYAVEVNAPFSVIPTAGSPLGATVTYAPATDLSTVSIFDYWSPAGAVNRILAGAAVESMRVKVNGDYHEFEFRGLAKDILDSTSFASGQGGLASFPDEPPLEAFDYTIIPGHLGQAWLGNTPDRFYTITEAELTLENDVEARTREFGTDTPLCITAGPRSVALDFELFEMNDQATKGLYQAARQFSPVAVMFQLGQQPGQLFGAYLKSVVPEVPEFDDSDTRLRWRFTGCLAQGTGDDEMFVAFG